MRGRAGDAKEEAGVSAVEPNTCGHTELRGTIQEAESALGGAVCDGEEPPETRRRWMRRRSQNPSHGIGTAGEHRRPGSAAPAGQEDGGRRPGRKSVTWWPTSRESAAVCRGASGLTRERQMGSWRDGWVGDLADLAAARVARWEGRWRAVGRRRRTGCGWRRCVGDAGESGGGSSHRSRNKVLGLGFIRGMGQVGFGGLQRACSLY